MEAESNVIGVEKCPKVGEPIVDGAVCQLLFFLKHHEVRQVLLGEFIHELLAATLAELCRSQRVRQQGAMLLCGGSVVEVDGEGVIDTDPLRSIGSRGLLRQQSRFLEGSCRQRSVQIISRQSLPLAGLAQAEDGAIGVDLFLVDWGVAALSSD
jgi:hypothetical protein